MARDRDIRNDVQSKLMATGAFDAVYLWSLAEVSDRSADDQLAAAIEPLGWQETDEWDDVAAGEIQIHGHCRLTVMARDESPQVRDEACEDLLAFACNALNGQSLAGLTLPFATKIIRVQWKPANPPERQIEATLVYVYLVDNMASFDESE